MLIEAIHALATAVAIQIKALVSRLEVRTDIDIPQVPCLWISPSGSIVLIKEA